MPPLKRIILTIAVTFWLSLPAWGEQIVRVATYNIKFLSTNVTNQGDRLEKLREVRDLLDADVIGLQEIDDRAALELVFPSSDWHIVIDDESGENQDVALVVRKPFAPRNLDSDLDADDRHFLFPGAANNSHFPDRRDLIAIEIQVPNENATFFVLVHHAKSRFGGRANNDHRREGASRDILRIVEQRFDDSDFILIGDFNDNPDDRSLNILETGNPDAPAGPEEITGPFLVNLTEPLLAAGHVSHGRKSNEIINGRIDTIDPESRARNNAARGTNEHTGDILFDQILIPARMFDKYVQGSAEVFNHEVGARGNDRNRASDHLPVFAEFVFGGEEAPVPPGTPIQIASLLPNPQGTDRGNEQVTLQNATESAVDLNGWRLRDRAGNEFALAGTIGANDTRTVTLPGGVLPLNNSGDDVSLIDPEGNVRHHVSYSAADARPGRVVTFP